LFEQSQFVATGALLLSLQGSRIDQKDQAGDPSPPEGAMKQRIQRLGLGTPFDLYASPKPTINQPLGRREARKQWGSLNPAEKTVVEHVLRNGRVPLAELLRWMNNEGIKGGIDTVRSITRTTNFLQGGTDEGYWTNPEFETQLEELIGS
jgi:hypothetical protein